MALGVSYNGEKIHETHLGFRDVSRQVSPNSDTVYGIGSITKLFTASAIGILVDEGLVNWTTPLREVLPEFHHQDEWVERGLTVSYLLAHKSGLAVSTEWWYGAEGVLLLPKSQTIRSFGALRSVGPLRTRYDYNNWNYAVLGEVIERLSGLSYGEYLRVKILEPLDMGRTSVSRVTDQEEGNIALPYAVLDDHSAYTLPFPRSEDGQLMASAQAVRSTVDDLLKYMSALDSAYHCFGIYRNQLPNTFEGLGCNSMFVGQMPTMKPGNEASLVLSQGGSLAGYTTFVTMLPQINCSIVVLVNSIGLGDPAGWINNQVTEALIETVEPNDYEGGRSCTCFEHRSNRTRPPESAKVNSSL